MHCSPASQGMHHARLCAQSNTTGDVYGPTCRRLSWSLPCSPAAPLPAPGQRRAAAAVLVHAAADAALAPASCGITSSRAESLDRPRRPCAGLERHRRAAGGSFCHAPRGGEFSASLLSPLASPPPPLSFRLQLKAWLCERAARVLPPSCPQLACLLAQAVACHPPCGGSKSFSTPSSLFTSIAPPSQPRSSCSQLSAWLWNRSVRVPQLARLRASSASAARRLRIPVTLALSSRPLSQQIRAHRLPGPFAACGDAAGLGLASSGLRRPLGLAAPTGEVQGLCMSFSGQRGCGGSPRLTRALASAPAAARGVMPGLCAAPSPTSWQSLGEASAHARQQRR